MRNRLVLYATLIWGAIMCGWLVVDFLLPLTERGSGE